MTSEPMHAPILGAGSPWANQFPILIVLVLMLAIESDVQQIEHEQKQEHDYEVESTRLMVNVPARERRLRRVDLLTWSCNVGPNQRVRSRRSLTKRTIR